MLFTLFVFFLSIIGLLYSSSLSLDSGERLGKSFGLSDMVIGVVFIGFGTSLPELLVSHMASIEGKSLISLGNILGSNISNTTLILGISALLTRISLKEESQVFQAGILVLVSGIITANYFLFEFFDFKVGIILLVIFIFYLYKSINDDQEDNVGKLRVNRSKELFLLVLGFVIMFFSGKYLISSISEIGRHLGFSEYVISAIALALGTSAPELFTAIMAIKKKKDVALIFGNILGSNVFNIALVLGTTSFYGMKLTSSFRFDFLCVLILGCWLLMRCLMKKDLNKISGISLLFLYGFCIHYWLNNSY